MKCYLYILKSEVKETFYVGISNDPERRIQYHNKGDKGYTRKYRPWRIVYTKLFDTKEDALKAEKKVKGWKSKKMIKLLIVGSIDILNYIK